MCLTSHRTIYNFPSLISLPEIHKLHGHGKFMGAHGGDNGLQFVAALAVHAYFVTLNLRRDLELAIANEAGDLLGHGALDALLDLDASDARGRAARCRGRIAPRFSS